ncbi:MAG: ABC transporter permease [Pirellulaceae bacterium]|jgi:ABC-2 type transport system permease protein|nr:ABC transporter permease [Pirellulaceae bacterium]
MASTGSRPAIASPLAVAWSLAWREIVRFFRQRNRIIGSIGTPLVFWLLFGAGLSGSFRMGTGTGGPSFLEFFFPGSLLLLVLFTAIFSSISIIEDRREGFLQGVLVAPIPRWSMVLGKVLGGTLIAVFQGLIFLLLALTLPIEFPWRWLPALVGLISLAALGLTSLGFVFAWRLDSTQGFHAIMNLVLMPMWLLSGGFFPVPAAAAGGRWPEQALHFAMRANPLTYSVSGVRQLLSPGLDYTGSYVPELTWCWIVTLAFAGICFAAAVAVSRQPAPGDSL